MKTWFRNQLVDLIYTFLCKVMGISKNSAVEGQSNVKYYSRSRNDEQSI